MPTTRHGYSGFSGEDRVTIYGIPPHMMRDHTQDGAINRAAHAAMFLANLYPGNDAKHIRFASQEFGAPIPNTVDKINEVTALAPFLNRQVIT